MKYLYLSLTFVLISTAGALHTKEVDYTNSSYATVRKACLRDQATVLETRIDLHECDSERIRDTKALEAYLSKMCVLLRIPDWTDTRLITCDSSLLATSSGCTFVQLSGGAFIMGRVINETNGIQITISANACYDPQELIQFSKKFFGATATDTRIMLRK